MKSLTRKSLPAALLCLTLSVFVVLPFFYIGEVPNSGCCGGAMPVTHDSWMHYNQMRSFWEGVASGRIYPRWDAGTHKGYGAPTTSFYPPGIYFLTSAYYLILRDWSRVLIALHLTMIAASGAAIYVYARQMMTRGSGLIAIAVYVTAPYHLINLYQRGAIAEQLSFVWMPLILMFAERIVEGRSKLIDQRTLLNFAGLSASFGAFLWSHPPTAYQFLLVFGACFVLWIVWGRKHDSDLALPGFLILCSLIFGSMLAAAYLYPAILEQNLINADDVERTWPYHSSYVFDYAQTIYDHQKDGFIAWIDRIWLYSIVAIALTGILLLFLRNHLQLRVLRARVLLWFPAGLLAACLMTKYSDPFTRIIPKMSIGVFSWRMLTITSLVIALLAGVCWQAAVDLIAQRRRIAMIISGASSLLIVIISAVMSFNYVVKPMYRAEAFKPVPDHYNFSTIPKGVPREVPAMELAQLASGHGRVMIERWEPEFRQFHVELEREDQLHIRTSNFPGWTAIVDGQTTAIKNGAVQNIFIELMPGTHQVVLDFSSTPVRRLSNLITVFSIVLLATVVIIATRRSI